MHAKGMRTKTTRTHATNWSKLNFIEHFNKFVNGNVSACKIVFFFSFVHFSAGVRVRVCVTHLFNLQTARFMNRINKNVRSIVTV